MKKILYCECGERLGYAHSTGNEVNLNLGSKTEFHWSKVNEDDLITKLVCPKCKNESIQRYELDSENKFKTIAVGRDNNK
jgi:cytochrome c1